MDDVFDGAGALFGSALGGGLVSLSFSWPTACTGRWPAQTCENVWGGTAFVMSDAQSSVISAVVAAACLGLAALVRGASRP